MINAKGEFGPRDVTDFALSDLYAIGDLFYPLWNLLQLSATGNLACQAAMLVAHLRNAM